MSVAGCFIFSSKITRNRLSAGLCPDPLGKRKKKGWDEKGKKGREGLSPRMKILATALVLTYRCLKDTSVRS